MLEKSDYAFLERFLDVTKANLFFARAIVIVEGDAENLLLPAIAKSIGKSFSELGVSVVNVGHVGLFRYGNIFRRKDGQELSVRVACLRDRDVTPDDLPDELRGSLKRESDLTDADKSAIVEQASKRDGGAVRTFLSDHWTFEYDLARSSWEMARVMHQAVSCAQASSDDPLDDGRFQTVCTDAAASVDSWRAEGKSLAAVALLAYKPLNAKGASKAVSKAVTAQYAAKLLEGVSLSEGDLPAYLRATLNYVAGVGGGATCG
jgi:putative ATP-dependent endonuclease of OLD family